jgi:leucyl/phenylalanyl-tRNA--protein transferase
VHSVEAYQDGVLVGGLYGVSVGRVFCGESMFAKVSDASKVAFAVLVERLREWGYDFIDCQVPTDHLKSLGAKEVSREYFLERLVIGQDEKLTLKVWK